jgi:uncharacterized membrane protein YdbT with pleckstrin-like domain
MENLKHPIILFWICVLLHLIADYYLQGCLADLKQKKWWDKQLKEMFGPDYKLDNHASKYLDDYLQALRDHAFMWSILTFLPMMLVVGPWTYTAIVIINALVHAAVDDLKANDMKINLQTDQWLHFLQIAITVAIVQLI